MMDEICTRRLVLRPLRVDDAEHLFALFNNWNVVQWLSSPPWPYTCDDARAFVAEQSENRHAGAARPWAIEIEDGLAGVVEIRTRPASHLQKGPGANLGYWLGQPYWGRGFMTEAVEGLIRCFFAAQPDDAVYSGAFAENVASLRVQQKLGFVRDGETMLHSRPRGAEFAHVNTVLTRERFKSLVA